MEMPIRNPIVAAALRLASPGYSTCGKCRVPWKYVESKSVNFSRSCGTFAMCIECWKESSLVEILRHWSAVYRDQMRDTIEGGYELEGSFDDRINAVKVDFYLNHPSQKGHRSIHIPVKSVHYPYYSIESIDICDTHGIRSFREFVIKNAGLISWKDFPDNRTTDTALGEEMLSRFERELSKRENIFDRTLKNVFNFDVNIL